MTLGIKSLTNYVHVSIEFPLDVYEVISMPSEGWLEGGERKFRTENENVEPPGNAAEKMFDTLITFVLSNPIH
jgi:hypothetical protein